MRSVSVRLADLERVTIPIGFEGENEYTHVHIDCKKVFDEDNSFVPTLALVAPSGEKYPGIVTRDGDIVTWVVSASDLAERGAGELQLAFTKDNVIGKTYVARTRVERSITPDGEAPSVIENFIIEAGAIVNGIPQAIEDAIDDVMGDITAEAETLQPGSSASASFDPETKAFTFGIPTGAKGDPGDPGEPGEDGYSPSASVSKNGNVATISITDKNGTTTATISDGEDGTDGDDGFSPIATVSKAGKTATISITDKNGTTTASVSDGEDADPFDIIDDTTPALDKTFSSSKLNTDLGSLLNAITSLNNSKAPIIIDSASGAIATFPDGADDLPVESLIAEINPVQDLHGQSNPYPAGGNKNLFGLKDVSGIASGTNKTLTVSNELIRLQATGNVSASSLITSAAMGTAALVSSLSAGTYTFSVANLASSFGSLSTSNIRLELADGQVIASGNSFTLSAETGISAISCSTTLSYTSGSYVQFNVQVESGSTATAWSPYENICPISGFTGVKVARTGKNLLVKPFSYRPVPSTLADCFFMKAGTYTFSFDTIGTATSWRFGLSMFDTEGNALSGSSYKPNANMNFISSVMMWYYGADVQYKTMVLTLVTDCYIRVWFGSGNTSDGMEATNAQLEVGSEATSYEPYDGDTYSISWQTEAGTVYGGELDAVNGKLTVDKAYALLDNPDGWSGSASSTVKFVYSTGFSDRKKYSDSYTGLMCSYLPVKSATQQKTARWAGATSNVFGLATGDIPDLTLEQVKADAQAGKIAICYELAEPLEFDLDPVTIATLLGYNAIFADTGDVAVDYRADTKLWIDGHSGSSITVDSALSSTSENPVQNKVINTALNGKEPKHNTTTVSGTTPSITGVADTRYICGECSTLDITAPASGDIEVIFDSGSTATVLTVTPPTGVSSIKWANGFDPTNLDANTRYDLIITDGEWGLAASWA